MSGSSNRYNGRAGSRGQHSPIYNILYNENNGIQSKAIHTGKGDNRKNKEKQKKSLKYPTTDKERRAFRSYPEENDLTQDFRKLNVNDQKPKYSSSNASNSAVVPVGHKQMKEKRPENNLKNSIQIEGRCIDNDQTVEFGYYQEGPIEITAIHTYQNRHVEDNDTDED